MAEQSKQGPGRGWHGDPEGHARAGRKGGQATARSHNREFYENIGREGGEASPTQFKSGDQRTKQAASKGGRARGRSNQQAAY